MKVFVLFSSFYNRYVIFVSQQTYQYRYIYLIKKICNDNVTASAFYYSKSDTKKEEFFHEIIYFQH